MEGRGVDASASAPRVSREPAIIASAYGPTVWENGEVKCECNRQNITIECYAPDCTPTEQVLYYSYQVVRVSHSSGYSCQLLTDCLLMVLGGDF